jgi:hypothetical protein
MKDNLAMRAHVIVVLLKRQRALTIPELKRALGITGYDPLLGRALFSLVSSNVVRRLKASTVTHDSELLYYIPWW